jgi:hypothetical protein
MNFDFPQYRKLTNNKSYYKIDSPDEMIEIQLMGRYWSEHNIKASILPERLLISDLLTSSGEHYAVISEDEFASILQICMANMIKH